MAAFVLLNDVCDPSTRKCHAKPQIVCYIWFKNWIRRNSKGKRPRAGFAFHLAIAVFTIFAAWRWADWQNWQQYHATMLYIAAGGFLYEYLTKDYPLWLFIPDFLYNHTITVIVYAVITMPLSVIIFLSRFPKKMTKQLMYTLMWVLIYAVIEWEFQHFGRIEYRNGWNFGYSVLFDLMMFPMLWFHHRKPVGAYTVSIIIIISLMLWFNVPMKD